MPVRDARGRFVKKSSGDQVIDIPVDFDLPGAKAQLSGINAIFSQTFGDMTGPIDAVKTGILAAGAALAALTIGIVVTTQAATEFGDKIAEVETLIDSSFASTEELTEATKELAATYGKAPVAQVEALYQTISAGADDATAATELLTVANELAIGGITSVEKAVDGLTSVLNAYSIGFEQATDVSDDLFTAVKRGKTTIDELASAVGRVVPLASSMEIEFGEVASALAAMTAQGINTNEAVTSLNAIITNIIQPTKEATEEAIRLGVEFDSTALRAQGLAGFLDSVTTSAKFNTQTLEKLFGSVRGLGGVIALTKNESKEFNSILADTTDNAGASAEAFRIMSETLGFQTRRFGALRKVATITLGEMTTGSDNALKSIKGVNRALENMIEFFGSSKGKEAANAFFGTVNTGLQLTVALTNVAVKGLSALTGGTALQAVSEQLTETLALISSARVGFVEAQGDINKSLAESTADAFLELSLLRQEIQDDLVDGVNEGLKLERLLRAQALEDEIASNRARLVARGFTLDQIGKLEQDALRAELGISETRKTKKKEDAAESDAVRDARIAKEKEDAARRREDMRADTASIDEDLRHRFEIITDGEQKIADEVERIRQTAADISALIGEETIAQSNAQADALENVLARTITIGGNAMGQFFADITQAAFEGDITVGQALEKFGATLLGGIGAQLIALGTAAVVAGALGTVAPIFLPATGGPAGVAAGIALIAAGGVLAGVGGAVSAGVSRSVRSDAKARADAEKDAEKKLTDADEGRARRGRSFADSSLGRFVSTPKAGVTVIENHFNLSGQLMVSTPAEAGRTIEGMISQSERLGGRTGLGGRFG